MIAQLRPADIVLFRDSEDRTVYVVAGEPDSLGHVNVTPLVWTQDSPRPVRTVPVRTLQRIP